MADKTDLTGVYVLLILIGLQSCSTPSQTWVDSRMYQVERRVEERLREVARDADASANTSARWVAIDCPEGVEALRIQQQRHGTGGGSSSADWTAHGMPQVVPCAVGATAPADLE